MKFTCTKENLSYALDLVSGVAGKQSNLPILMNIMIQATEAKVELMATNLEVAVKAGLRAKVDQSGSFTVPAKTLTDYVHLLTDEQVQVELEQNELKIVSGHSSTKIKGTPADEYPVIPNLEEEHAYLLSAEALREALSETVIAAAKNDIRLELSGIYFGFFTDRYQGLVLAATDSYRLAEKKAPVTQGQDEMRCIVSARTVYEMIRLITLAKGDQAEKEVRLWVSASQIAIRYDQFEMSARLVDGKYPDYAQIIPGNFKTTAFFPLGVMVNKIKAASLFTTVGVNAVAFDLNVNEQTIAVSSTSTQTGEHSSEVDAELKGEENSILLNHRYVLDGLQQMNDNEEVEFGMNSGDAPCLFKPKGKDDYVYIVMPIRQ